jgi:hypothetical protein
MKTLVSVRCKEAIWAWHRAFDAGTTDTAPAVELGAAVSSEGIVDAMTWRWFAWRCSPRFVAATDLFAVCSTEPQKPVAQQSLDLRGGFIRQFG